jgi:glycerophosphoryl diester phosphodiesterase
MRSRWLIGSLSAIIAVAAGIGVAALIARPAPDHPFFSGMNPGIIVIAHRGGAQRRPENTLVAFEHAAAIGADVLEMDLRATADGSIVALHDATVERTTDGRGRVDSMTLAELQKLDAGYQWTNDGGRTYPFRGKGIHVPTLEEVFQRFPAQRLNLEMKRVETDLAIPLCALIRRSGMTQRVLVASMDVATIEAFRRACPDVATSMSRSEALTFFGLQRVWLSAVYSPPVQALQVPYFFGDSTVPTPGFVAAARRKNFKLHVWTINDDARMRQLIKLGVDGIVTDRPDRVLSLLGRTRTAR